jgi:hypothetical protein
MIYYLTIYLLYGILRYRRLNIGDAVSRINGVSVSELNFNGLVSRIQYLPRPIIIHFVQLVSTRTGLPCAPSIPDHSPPCLPDKPNFPPPPIPTNFNYPDSVSNVWVENEREREGGVFKTDHRGYDGVDMNSEGKEYGYDDERERGGGKDGGNERDNEMRGEYDETEYGEKSKAEKLKSALKGGYVATSMTQAVRLKDSTCAVSDINFDVYETSKLKEKIRLEHDLLREKQEKERQEKEREIVREKEREKEKEKEERETKAELVREKERLAKEEEEERKKEEENKRIKEESEKVEKMKNMENEKTVVQDINRKKTEGNDDMKRKEINNEEEEQKLIVIKQQEEFFSTPIGDNNDNNNNSKIEEENEENIFESLENKFDDLFETENISSNFTDLEEENIFSTPANNIKNKKAIEVKQSNNISQNNENNRFDDFDEIFGNVSPNEKSEKSVKTGNVTIFDGVYEDNENDVEKEIDEFPEICLNSPDDFESETVNKKPV